MKKLYGVICAMTTPFDEHDKVDVPALAEFSESLVKRGVHCLYPAGTTGEMLLMTPEERELGIVCGYTWMNQAEKVIFYTDLGMSPGMLMAREAALALDVDIEERTLPAFFPASPANPTSSRV